MAAHFIRLVVALVLSLSAALSSSAAAALVHLPTSHQTVSSPVPARGGDPAYASSYFGARYYRPDIGRFTTVDPVYNWSENLVDPQRWNRYAYARNNPLAYVDPSGLAIELLGSEEERKRALGVLQEGVGGVAGSRLYINAVTSENTTRYFVGIQGSVDEFKGLAGNVSSSLGDLILNKNVVEFGLTDKDLSRFGGGATYGAGEAGDNANIRVLINPAQISIRESRLSPNTVLGAMKWDPGEVRGLTMPITAWHEFGHAWGGIHGRLPISPATNAEALIWENYMRLATYGPFGPHNARRKIH